MRRETAGLGLTPLGDAQTEHGNVGKPTGGRREGGGRGGRCHATQEKQREGAAEGGREGGKERSTVLGQLRQKLWLEMLRDCQRRRR